MSTLDALPPEREGVDIAKYRFEEQALPYLDEIFASAMRMARHREAAEDLVSIVFSRAWRSFHQFEPATNLRAWLYRILTNTYINHYQKKKRQPLMVELDRPEDTSDGTGGDLYDKIVAARHNPLDTPHAVLANGILDQDIKKAIESLPEAFRLVVIISDVQGFAYKEAAAILDIPVGTVRSRLWRGRRLLQNLLWEYMRPGEEARRAFKDDEPLAVLSGSPARDRFRA